MGVEIRINEAALAELLTGPSGPVVREVRRITRRVLNEALRRVNRDEGHLANSLQATLDVVGTRVIGTVGSHLDYAIYVHNGTGLYGPKKRVIRPVSSKVLAWEGRDPKRQAKGRGDGMVFRPYVKGYKGNPFLVDALEAASPYPVIKHDPI